MWYRTRMASVQQNTNDIREYVHALQPHATEQQQKLADEAVQWHHDTFAWYSEIEESVLDLVQDIPTGVADQQIREVLTVLLQLRQQMEAEASLALTAAAQSTKEAAMQMGDIAQQIHQQHQYQQMMDVSQAFIYIVQRLPTTSSRQLGELLGVTGKTIKNWKDGRTITAAKSPRVVLVAQTLSLFATTEEADLLVWFRTVIDTQQTPLQLMDADIETARGKLLVTAAMSA